MTGPDAFGDTGTRGLHTRPVATASTTPTISTSPTTPPDRPAAMGVDRPEFSFGCTVPRYDVDGVGDAEGKGHADADVTGGNGG